MCRGVPDAVSACLAGSPVTGTGALTRLAGAGLRRALQTCCWTPDAHRCVLSSPWEIISLALLHLISALYYLRAGGTHEMHLGRGL